MLKLMLNDIFSVTYKATRKMKRETKDKSISDRRERHEPTNRQNIQRKTEHYEGHHASIIRYWEENGELLMS